MFTFESWDEAETLGGVGASIVLEFLKQAHAQGKVLQWMDQNGFRGEERGYYPGTFVRATPDYVRDPEFPNDGEWIIETPGGEDDVARGRDFYHVTTADDVLNRLLLNMNTLAVVK